MAFVLCVDLHDATVRKADSVGKSDPYVVVNLGSEAEPIKTSVQKNTLSPAWHERFYRLLLKNPQHVKLELFDEDTFGKDDGLGYAIVPVEVNKRIEGTFKLEATTTGAVRAAVSLYKLSTIMEVTLPFALQTFQERLKELPPLPGAVKGPSHILEVNILQGRNFGNAEYSARVKVGNKILAQTQKIKGSNPAWNALTHSLVEATKTFTLEVQEKNSKYFEVTVTPGWQQNKQELGNATKKGKQNFSVVLEHRLVPLDDLVRLLVAEFSKRDEAERKNPEGTTADEGAPAPAEPTPTPAAVYSTGQVVKTEFGYGRVVAGPEGEIQLYRVSLGDSEANLVAAAIEAVDSDLAEGDVVSWTSGVGTVVSLTPKGLRVRLAASDAEHILDFPSLTRVDKRALRYSVGQPVATPFGVGVVDAPARFDNIVQVKLHGAQSTAFLNLDSLRPLPLQEWRVGDKVTTPYGPGTVLKPARLLDGITEVQLPGAVGYLNNDTMQWIPGTKVITPFGVGHVESGPRKADEIVTVRLPFGLAFLNPKSVTQAPTPEDLDESQEKEASAEQPAQPAQPADDADADADAGAGAGADADEDPAQDEAAPQPQPLPLPAPTPVPRPVPKPDTAHVAPKDGSGDSSSSTYWLIGAVVVGVVALGAFAVYRRARK